MTDVFKKYSQFVNARQRHKYDAGDCVKRCPLQNSKNN